MLLLGINFDLKVWLPNESFFLFLLIFRHPHLGVIFLVYRWSDNNHLKIMYIQVQGSISKLMWWCLVGLTMVHKHKKMLPYNIWNIILEKIIAPLNIYIVCIIKKNSAHLWMAS